MFCAKLVSTVFGTTFILFGIIGFVTSPIFAADILVAANISHNFDHLLIGSAFLAGAWVGHARFAMLAIGIAYFAAAMIGFSGIGETWFGPIHIQPTDRWLYLWLSAAILCAWRITTLSTARPTFRNIPDANGIALAARLHRSD